MNTNSIPETQTAKAKDDVRVHPSFGGTLDSKDHTRDIFLWPENHVVYVVALQDSGLGYDVWSVKEEHIDRSGWTYGEDDLKRDYLHIIIYTKEGGEYTLEKDAFMTTVGAYREANMRNMLEECMDDAHRAATYASAANSRIKSLFQSITKEDNK